MRVEKCCSKLFKNLPQYDLCYDVWGWVAPQYLQLQMSVKLAACYEYVNTSLSRLEYGQMFNWHAKLCQRNGLITNSCLNLKISVKDLHIFFNNIKSLSRNLNTYTNNSTASSNSETVSKFYQQHRKPHGCRLSEVMAETVVNLVFILTINHDCYFSSFYNLSL